MNIAVIGGGSIGLLVSSYLAKKHHVTLYVKRSTQQHAVEKQHIHVLKYSLLTQKVQVNTKLIGNLQENHQLYIVCVKQSDISNILTYIHFVQAPILFLQNGMSHIDKLQTLSQRVYLGVVSHGAKRTQDFEVNFLGEGLIKLASFSGEVNELKQWTSLLHSSDFPFMYVEDWEVLLKDKLIVNAVINPLTALFDVPNGKIIKNQQIAVLAKKICEETAFALGMSPLKSWEKVVITVEATSDNMSSMRSDIKKQKQTELEAITGYVLRQSKQELPYTKFIYHAILALSQEGE